jgi:uncharacterized membrane protein (UPF0127 family)
MIIYCNEILVADQVKCADTFAKKLIGLLNKKKLPAGEGLLLENCSSIHCFFMQFPIDAVYISEDLKVLFVETVRPWRIGSFVRKTKHILELPAGSASGVTVGAQIKLLKA